jgi:AcrR family transcriptional regulator
VGQRARKAEDKQQRRHAILAAAWELFQSHDYHDITMTHVAEQCGLVKGTVYLYFRTKEQLFLALQEEQLQAWLDALDASMRDSATRHDPAHIDPAHIADVICESIATRPALARLLTILHTVLERNIDFDAALAFKQMLLMRLTQSGTLLEACLPYLTPGQGASYLLHIYALIIGLFQLADPAPIVRQVLAQPGMAALRVEFAPALRSTLAALLAGAMPRP